MFNVKTKEFIQKRLRTKGEVRAAEVIKKTGFSRNYINRLFQELQREGKVRLIGKANRARYVPAGARSVRKAMASELSFHRMLRNRNVQEDIILGQIKTETAILSGTPENVERIVEYGFTEMLNNAIEHSQSRRISVRMHRSEAGISFVVVDHGIGIFHNIMATRNLSNELEAIQDLLKGKQTTAPQAHSGEGIFFTSKLADTLEIRSSVKKLTFNNRIGDYFVRDAKSRKGTQVEFWISMNSKRKLESVFRQFTDEGFAFDKTSVAVKLYKVDSGFVSRSQARRIISGLEKFQKIVLDFKNVELVGQAFVDEVFRVWKSNHPRKTIEVKNTNRNVQFMIDHVRE